ncbi:hypothetical protein P7C73_g2782, partial [Tremellales sp. Uapishka_1]
MRLTRRVGFASAYRTLTSGHPFTILDKRSQAGKATRYHVRYSVALFDVAPSPQSQLVWETVAQMKNHDHVLASAVDSAVAQFDMHGCREPYKTSKDKTMVKTEGPKTKKKKTKPPATAQNAASPDPQSTVKLERSSPPPVAGPSRRSPGAIIDMEPAMAASVARAARTNIPITIKTEPSTTASSAGVPRIVPPICPVEVMDRISGRKATPTLKGTATKYRMRWRTDQGKVKVEWMMYARLRKLFGDEGSAALQRYQLELKKARLNHNREEAAPTEYERVRLERIEENKKLMTKLGL